MSLVVAFSICYGFSLSVLVLSLTSVTFVFFSFYVFSLLCVFSFVCLMCVLSPICNLFVYLKNLCGGVKGRWNKG